MKQFSELSAILSEALNLNKARIDCLSRLLFALVTIRTVNLAKLAVAFDSEAHISSRHKRLKRFFSQVDFDYDRLATWLFQLFFSADKSFYLTIDRTNWFWGKSKINIFVLSIAYEGLAIPIFWALLNKAGSTSGKEQIALLQRFVTCFGKDNIMGLLGDREFANGELFAWLNQENIPFYIRIKEGSRIRFGKKKWKTAAQLFKQLGRNESSVFRMDVEIFAQKVYLAASRAEGQLMIVATNAPPQNAIPIYLRRWEIENLFQALKGRGFRFEDTRITCPKRIERLMALLAIGFCWVHRIGEWKHKRKPIKWRRFKKQRCHQYTYFRYGLDHINDLLTQFRPKCGAIKHLIKLLKPEKKPEKSCCGGGI